MAIRTKSEIARLCGISPAAVGKAVKKQILIVTKLDGKEVIDDKHPVNKAQIEDWQNEREEKNKPADYTKNLESTTPEITAAQKKALRIKEEKAELDLQLKKVELEKKQIEKDKLLGKSIPTDLVKNIFITLGQSFQSNYKIGADKWSEQVFHKTKAAPEVVEELKHLLTEIVNKVHSDAITQATVALKKLVDDAKADGKK